MTEARLIELGFSEVAPGFWVGSVFSIQRLVQQVREEKDEEAKRDRCAAENGLV